MRKIDTLEVYFVVADFDKGFIKYLESIRMTIDNNYFN
jgi:hypothetical protein